MIDVTKLKPGDIVYTAPDVWAGNDSFLIEPFEPEDMGHVVLRVEGDFYTLPLDTYLPYPDKPRAAPLCRLTGSDKKDVTVGPEYYFKTQAEAVADALDRAEETWKREGTALREMRRVWLGDSPEVKTKKLPPNTYPAD